MTCLVGRSSRLLRSVRLLDFDVRFEFLDVALQFLILLFLLSQVPDGLLFESCVQRIDEFLQQFIGTLVLLR